MGFKNISLIPNTALNAKKLQIIFLGLACLFIFIGCGPSTYSHSTADNKNLSSVGDRGDQTKPQATCNRVTEGDVDIKVMAYTDANGNRNNSFVRLKFLSVPTAFTNSGYDIHIVKWTASPTGVVSPASNEAPLYVNSKFEIQQGAQFNNASNWGFNAGGAGCSTCLSLDWYNFQLLAQQNNVTLNSSQDFFDKFNLLMDLNDPNGDWKVLQVQFKNNGTTVKHVNILIPTFDANPEDYEKTHAAVLNNLHPFISKKGQGFTSSQFQSFANAHCF
jgi:hypothetical protein